MYRECAVDSRLRIWYCFFSDHAVMRAAAAEACYQKVHDQEALHESAGAVVVQGTLFQVHHQVEARAAVMEVVPEVHELVRTAWVELHSA